MALDADDGEWHYDGEEDSEWEWCPDDNEGEDPKIASMAGGSRIDYTWWVWYYLFGLNLEVLRRRKFPPYSLQRHLFEP